MPALAHQTTNHVPATCHTCREHAQRVEDLEKLVERLEEESRTDPLTGLANRRRLTKRLETAWGAAAPNVACVMIDLDGFKALNDQLGHPAGDALLEMVGGVLHAHTRREDVAARFGGDEFCVVMANVEPDDARAAAKRLHRAFRKAAARVTERRVGMTIGFAHGEENDVPDGASLLARADEALCVGKQMGKGKRWVRVDAGPEVPGGVFQAASNREAPPQLVSIAP